MPNWTPIHKLNMHGYEAAVGKRKVEIVRCYASEWTIFFYIDGQMVTRRDSRYPLDIIRREPHRTYTEARKDANSWLLEAHT